MLIAANKRGMSVERIDLRNSGDTAGKKDKVVGFGSWAVCGDSTKAPIEYAPPDSDRDMLEKEGARIFRAAAQAIGYSINKGKPPKVDITSFPKELQKSAPHS